MDVDPAKTALFAFIKKGNPQYYGKLLELRTAVKGWLTYIPQTFGHYTRHTIEHSDEIVAQVSKLLFKPTGKTSVVKLTPTEAYILAASAYLHDAGMVVADDEKAKILQSDDWKSWTTKGGGSERWAKVEAFRDGEEPPDKNTRYFLADVQVRHLIAEFVRPDHHLRAAEVIAQHEVDLGLFAFGDPMLREAIADTCVGHGLRTHELEDGDRYPDVCQIQGEDVNLRFVAIMLRLGDLLDMTYDRACPWLMNAACPMPPTSYAHWTQYQRITRRLTSPDRISITAKCKTQEEHRVLQDWCQWIVDEVSHARTLMATAGRHGNWKLPEARIDGPSPTIIIKAAKGAKYFWSEWKLELDNDVIFKRLIYDVYDSPETFIRELIQNALDATRCQMYADLKADGVEPPTYPTEVAEETRQRYAVKVTLSEVDVPNELSGKVETKQVLTVEDCGLGMDQDVIERYFLQIGRTYYDTEDFRTQFGFVPTSRFGLGFLSVFAVSDHVVVETFKPSSGKRPLRLTLTGPRNYLLTETGDQETCGTRISVTLREPLRKRGEVLSLGEVVSDWCKKVEFPVMVNGLGHETEIEAESPEDFTSLVPHVSEENAHFEIRAFPTNIAGIDGEFYVLVFADDHGEAWSRRNWARHIYPVSHPQATTPDIPTDLSCLHGIESAANGRYSGDENVAVRVDYRQPPRESISNLSRIRPHWDWTREPLLVQRLEEIVSDHLGLAPRAGGEAGWQYKQSLVEFFPLHEFWAAQAEMIPLYLEKGLALESLRNVQSYPLIVTVMHIGAERSTPDVTPHATLPYLLEQDIKFISYEHLNAIFRKREVAEINYLDAHSLSVSWRQRAEDAMATFNRPIYHPTSLASFPHQATIGGTIHKTTDNIYDHMIFNTDHEFVTWLASAYQACKEGLHGMTVNQFDSLMSMVDTTLRHPGHRFNELETYLAGWRSIPGLPDELKPPKIDLSQNPFGFRPLPE